MECTESLVRSPAITETGAVYVYNPNTQEVEVGKSAPAELHSEFKAILGYTSRLGYMRLFL